MVYFITRGKKEAVQYKLTSTVEAKLRPENEQGSKSQRWYES